MSNFTQSGRNYQPNTPTQIKRIKQDRAPTTNDYRNFFPGDEWLDTSSDDWWKFVERTAPTSGLWVKIGGTSAAAETFTGNNGSAVGPDAANNLNLLGADTTTVVGNPATNTLTITTTASGYPITPYVVGPVGQAGYQTIQSALDAANADGGGIVGVQPGTYTEDLTLYDLTEVVALGLSDSGDGVTIIGVHTPPTTGGFVFRNLILQSATHIFNSAAAGSAHLIIADSAIVVTNGYTFNLPNWIGKLETFDVNDRGSTNDGYVNNTGGAEVVVFDAAVGAGSANSMITSGPVTFFGADVNCPVDFQTGSQVFIDSSVIIGSLTFSNNSTGDIANSHFAPGANPAITHSSSGAINISECVIESSNNPAIDGAGAGVFTYTDLVFLGNATIAGTLTTANGTWRPFSQADAVPTPTDNGTCHFDSAAFQVDADGFVQLAGGGTATESYIPDTGTSPVVPDASGQLSVLGQATPNTSGIQVTGGTNSLNIAMFSPFVGDFTFTDSTAGAQETVTVSNTDNTAASASSAAFVASVGGTTQTGDPYMQWSIGSARSYALGPDTSNGGADSVLTLTTDTAASVTPSSGTIVFQHDPTTDAAAVPATPASIFNVAVAGISRDAAGQRLRMTCTNEDDADTASAAVVEARVAGGPGSTAGDAFMSCVGNLDWSWGEDASTPSEPVFKFGHGGTPSTFTATYMTVQGNTSEGTFNYPLQPAFLATHTVAQDDATGTGGSVTVNFTTEIFDQNSDYDGTNTFTAPVTGRYLLRASVYVANASGSTSGQLTIATSNRGYRVQLTSGSGMVSDQYVLEGATFADMDAMDTATIVVAVSGMGADTADLSAVPDTTNFSGYLAV